MTSLPGVQLNYCNASAGGWTDLARLLAMADAADNDDEAVDPTFNLDSSIKSDVYHIIETFCDNWISYFKRDDTVSQFVVTRFIVLITAIKLKQVTV